MGVLYLVLIFASMYLVCVELERACANTAARLKIPESIAGATLVGGGAVMLHRVYTDPGPLIGETTLVVPRGASGRAIGALLADAGIVSDGRLLPLAWARCRRSWVRWLRAWNSLRRCSSSSSETTPTTRDASITWTTGAS